MRTLLINTGQYVLLKSGLPLNTFQPLGIAYIANVFLKNGYEVAIFDVLAEGYDHEEIEGKYKYVGLHRNEVKRRIKAFSPDMVGITIPFTAQAKAGHEMAKIVKNINKKIKVVMGGPYPTTHPNIILKDKNVDFVVRGEGEMALLELVKKIKKGAKKLDEVKGLGFRKKGKIKLNQASSPIMDLDNYRVAWDLLPMEKYFEAAYKIKSSRSISTFAKRWATILSSRGCPFSCTFCAARLVMGQRWRPRSVENVLEEMEYLINKYRVQHFDIEDDNFTLNKERAKAICDKIIEKKWKIQWSTPNGIRADTVDEELIKKMKQAGCVRTIVAPESGDQWVVNNLMKKRLDLEKVKQAVRWCRQYHLPVDAFFIIGMPGEKEENIRKTIEYAKELRKLGVDDCGFAVAIPHQGTELYEIVTKHGWLRDLAKEGLTEGLMIGEPMIETPYLSAQRVKELLKIANKVNPPIPFARFKLALLLMMRSPKRFIKLTISYLLKQVGFSEGLLGAE